MFKSCLTDTKKVDGCLESTNYFPIGCDLTKIELLEKMLLKNKVSFSLPTLLLSECVLTYISPTQ